MPLNLTQQWDKYAKHLAKSKAPIIVGPWRSEVGFELLYWLPFLCHFRKKYGIEKDRIIALGRGGSSAWYDAAGHADLYEFLPVETVRHLTLIDQKATGSVKQQKTNDWETHVTALAAAALGIQKYHVLSPSWMYQLVAPWWEGRQPIRWLDKYLLQPVTLAAPALEPELAAKLPTDYLAMRWYVRATWPHREDLILWMRKLTDAAARQMPVILIDSPLHVDDHGDINLGDIPNVTRLSSLTDQTPLTNLAVQSAVIARAKGYLGTYGGMAQGAMRWGVPTLSFYHTFAGTSHNHLALTQHLSLRTNVPFIAALPGHIEPFISLLTHKEAE